MKRVYLDNCCYNRPFDNQLQIRIRLEAQAKLFIQTLIHENKLELVWSYILEFENNANPFEERKNIIATWKANAVLYMEANENIIKMAKEFAGFGIKTKDSLHLACAIVGKANYFLSTDDKLLKRTKELKTIISLSPLEFIAEEDF